MIYYEDLLTAKYKPHGRGEDGYYDCYGLVLECCRRAGKKLIDPFKKYIHLPVGAELPTPALALHINEHGCRVTHIRALNAIRFYEVLDNESELN